MVGRRRREHKAQPHVPYRAARRLLGKPLGLLEALDERKRPLLELLAGESQFNALFRAAIK
jgi:hypothetical protein